MLSLNFLSYHFHAWLARCRLAFNRRCKSQLNENDFNSTIVTIYMLIQRPKSRHWSYFDKSLCGPRFNISGIRLPRELKWGSRDIRNPCKLNKTFSGKVCKCWRRARHLRNATFEGPSFPPEAWVLLFVLVLFLLSLVSNWDGALASPFDSPLPIQMYETLGGSGVSTENKLYLCPQSVYFALKFFFLSVGLSEFLLQKFGSSYLLFVSAHPPFQGEYHLNYKGKFVR